MFVLGTVAFAAASLLCGLAPTPGVLIAARILQGAGAALLTPGSLAMMQGAFRPADRPKAIGAWSGLAAIAAAVGPFVGGILVDYAVVAVDLPDQPAAGGDHHLDRGAVGPREPGPRRAADASTSPGRCWPPSRWPGSPTASSSGATPSRRRPWWWGVAASVAFVVAESRHPDPMLPLSLFASRTFSSANVMTLLVYAALGAVTFFVVLQLQTVSGYTALAAGVSMLPLTVCMVLLASRGGALGARIGPRIPMTLGPIVMGAGTMLLLAIGEDVDYWRDVLPGVTVFGLGLALMVAPLTATVLAAAPGPERRRRQRGQQRGRPDRLAARGRGAAGGRRALRGGVRRPGGVRRRLPLRDGRLRRDAGGRRAGVVVHDPQRRTRGACA